MHIGIFRRTKKYMMRKKISFVVYLSLHSFFFVHYSFSQSAVMDSLFSILKTSGEDTSRVKILNSLSGQFWQLADYQQALSYANQALLLAEKLSYAKGIADAYHYLGNIHGNQGKYELALKNYFRSLQIRKKMDDKKAMAASCNNIGNMYWYQGKYEQAMNQYMKSLKLKEKTGDRDGMAYSYNNIGMIFHLQGKYESALKNYLKVIMLQWMLCVHSD